MAPARLEISTKEISRRLKKAMQRLEAEQNGIESPYPSELLPEAPRPAAVLIPLLKREHDWHVLYTRRTNTLAEHSGQVAFPGGRCDPQDVDLEATALREAQEEIGLHPLDVRILGRLNEFLTITNYRVTPIVAAIPWPYPFRLAEVEVSKVFTIPLLWLADPTHLEERQRKLPANYGTVSVLYYQPYEGEILWGASARITQALLTHLQLIE